MPSNSPTRDFPGPPSGTLYVVATPIGNFEDITLRALKVLATVDWIAAEDTRVTQKLLRHHGLRCRLISYHEYNEDERAPELLGRLADGESGALVSSAGTPAVSDPGYRLLQRAADSGVTVVPIPGACAAVAGLSVSGLPSDAFTFVGFAPRKKGRRRELLDDFAAAPQTLVFYESPKRIAAFLDELAANWGDRQAVLCREMTKVHEELLRGSLTEIRKKLLARDAVKGEFTLLVCGRRDRDPVLTPAIASELREGLQNSRQTLTRLVKALSRKYGMPRNRLYAEALRIQDALPEAGGDGEEAAGPEDDL